MIDGMHTTSLVVAEYFGKKHSNVLRAIRDRPFSHEFRASHFEVRHRDVGNGRSVPYYRISRDGFILLALSFRGPKANRIRAAMVLDPSSYPDELRWEDSLLGENTQEACIAAFHLMGHPQEEVAHAIKALEQAGVPLEYFDQLFSDQGLTALAADLNQIVAH